MWRLFSGIFMGWSLGSNDSANIFGTAVASRMVRFRTAVILCAVFVLAGALLEGSAGLHTLSSLIEQTSNTAFLASLTAALTVTIMTMIHLPVSTSQAMVGAIIGIGLAMGKNDFSGLTKVVICWVGTPIGSAVAVLVFYPLLGFLLEKFRPHMFLRDRLLRYGLIGAGCYGAYALGANNVANVTGVYVGTGQLSIFMAALLGGLSIGLGAITYSRNVMKTVGRKLVKLDPFSAFIAVLASAITVHFYALVGVPVSTSQAIIGAVLGIGLIKGARTINGKTLLSILSGWISSPLIAGAIAFAAYKLFLG